MNVRYILGEDKYVKLLIHSQNNEPFEIQSARYELKRYGNIEQSGECVVDGHYISAKLCPEKIGAYEFVTTYMIADTVRKAKIRIEVV